MQKLTSLSIYNFIKKDEININTFVTKIKDKLKNKFILMKIF